MKKKNVIKKAVTELTIQKPRRGRPIDPNSARQQRLRGGLAKVSIPAAKNYDSKLVKLYKIADLIYQLIK